MKNTHSSVVFLAGPFIGDALLIFSTVSLLKNMFREVYFVTYHNDLITTLNPYDEIKVVDINSCKNILASEEKKIIISNHPGESVINGTKLPLIVSNNAKNYKFIDLYYRSSIFKEYKKMNYSKAMFEIISRFFKYKLSYRPNQLTISLKRKLNSNTSDITYVNTKYSFFSKEYIVLIEGTSMNAKKFDKWEQLIDKLTEITNGRYQIIRIHESECYSNKLDPTGRHYVYCNLKYYPYIFLDENCCLVVSTDTGLAHLSAMLGTKTFILYAISDPSFWNNGSRFYYPVIGKKNYKHVKKIKNDFIRLDYPDVRGDEFLTKEGFGVSLTTIEEIIHNLYPKIHY